MVLGDGFPPYYPERPTAVVFDLNQIYLGYSAAALLAGLLLILPGVRGKARIFFLLRWLASLFVGVSIVACIQGISWHEQFVTTELPFTGQSGRSDFEIGLKIGLASFNVTLTNNLDNDENNTMLFSEEFHFLNSDEELDRGLKAGLPFPILNILEHFSVHRVSSQWMWGRRYWIVGHFSLYLLWSSFGTWIIANILLHTVVRYGGLMLTLTGLLMVSANAIFSTIRSHGCDLTVHIGYYQPAVLQPQYGWCFWLCLGVGVLCAILGTVIFITDNICHNSLRTFFILHDEEYFDLDEINVEKSTQSSRRTSSVHSSNSDGLTNYAYENTKENLSHSSKPLMENNISIGLSTVNEDINDGDELAIQINSEKSLT